MYNYSKLLGRLKEKGITQEQLAKLIDKTETTVSLKLNCRAYFTQKEIDIICEALDLPDAEIKDYFFTKSV
jgi:transcriptional regulator with XRE-family HTH domain